MIRDKINDAIGLLDCEIKYQQDNFEDTKERKLTIEHLLKIEEILLDVIYEDEESKDPENIYNVFRFSPRIVNALYRNDILTVAKLEQCTEIELLKFKNLGKASIQEIKATLNRMDKKLKESSCE